MASLACGSSAFSTAALKKPRGEYSLSLIKRSLDTHFRSLQRVRPIDHEQAKLIWANHLLVLVQVFMHPRCKIKCRYEHRLHAQLVRWQGVRVHREEVGKALPQLLVVCCVWRDIHERQGGDDLEKAILSMCRKSSLFVLVLVWRSLTFV